MTSRDGRWLILRTAPAPPATPDILGLKAGDTTLVPLVASPATESIPRSRPTAGGWPTPPTSPGRTEVYVRPFPETASAKWQVSTAGGVEPTWSSTGRELLYINGKGDMVSAEIPAGATFSVGGQRTLFSIAQFAHGRAGPVVLPEPRQQAVRRAARGGGGTAGRAGRGGELGAAAGGACGEVRLRSS